VSGASAQTINEIRIDHESTDADEYFELRGTPSSSLTGLTYVVIGDGAGGCGTVEEVVSLAGKSIQADGYFVLGQAVPIGAQNFTYDALDTLTFENTDNLTHLLVTGWSGTLAQDLDTNNDGVLDVTPWTSIVDDVALLRVALPACGAPTVNDEPVYSADTVGPDGSFVPGHVWRCTDSGAWMIGPFNRVGGQDTPGAANTNCAAPPPSILEEERNVCAPLANQSVTVTDSISNATSATLTYSINGGAGVNVNMSSIGSNEWQAVIPGQAVNGTRVSYSVTANNASGSDVGFAQGYFVGFVDIEDVRAVDGTGVTLYRFYGVNLQGNVTAAQGTFSTVNTDFWFQDGTGGIRAFAFGPPVIASPALGDEVEVSGVLNQFNGLLEVESSRSAGR
jgi:hypothetical protein